MPRCISNIFLANCANILKLCENASSYYKTATLEQKQRLLKLLCLNLSFDGENVHIYLKSAFGEILKSANLEKIWGGRIRTSECLDQNQVPYHLATPHYRYFFILYDKSFLSIFLIQFP